MSSQKYKVRVVRGAFTDPTVLDDLGAKQIEKFESGDAWQSIDEVVADLDQIRLLQKRMVKHYDNPNIPWYMDGRGLENSDDVIVAFGADDGEGGKIFQFSKKDIDTLKKVINFGLSKGIPKEQLDFMEVSF